MSLIKYGSVGFVQWDGRENEEINFRPLFTGKLPTELGIRVVMSVKSKVKLNFFGVLQKVLMPYTKGFQGGVLAPKLQKILTLSEFKAEASFDKHDYKDMIYDEITNRGGTYQNDIEGTPVINAERKVFFDAVRDDVVRNFWLGDIDKLHTTAGTYPDGTTFAIGDPDKYYNQQDGVIAKLMNDSSTTAVPGTDNKVLKIVMPTTLVADSAETTMNTMFRKAPKVLTRLRDKGALRFYATSGFMENYEDTLRAGDLESSRTAKIDGISRFTFNGITILPLDIDGYLAADFPAAFPKEFCILTVPENLCLVLNSNSKFSETRFWFNPDENENRQRTQFEFGADYILPELVVISYKA